MRRSETPTVVFSRMGSFVLRVEIFVVETGEEVRPAIERAMEINDRPVFVDFHVWPEANVTPMIPAGKTVDDLIMEA